MDVYKILAANFSLLPFFFPATKKLNYALETHQIIICPRNEDNALRIDFHELYLPSLNSSSCLVDHKIYKYTKKTTQKPNQK